MSDMKKFLDAEGVKHLWSKVNMQDYPNNETLMAVINAIDETKADKKDLYHNVLIENYIIPAGEETEIIGCFPSFQIGSKYCVIFDNVIYDNLIGEYWEDEYHGIGAIGGDYSNYPFGFVSQCGDLVGNNISCYIQDTSVEHTISIYSITDNFLYRKEDFVLNQRMIDTGTSWTIAFNTQALRDWVSRGDNRFIYCCLNDGLLQPIIYDNEQDVWLYNYKGNIISLNMNYYYPNSLSIVDNYEDFVEAPTITLGYIQCISDLLIPNTIARQIDIDTKMNAENPVGTGSFSMNRLVGSKIGFNSHAEGSYTIASGENSHVEGSNILNTLIVTGMANSTEYIINNTQGYVGSYIVYNQNKVLITGQKFTGNDYVITTEAPLATIDLNQVECLIISGTTGAIGYSSHAEGNSTTASGENSHAEGNSTTASGENSHAEGNSTTAIGYSSHAEGNSTTASGENSHAEGNRTTASGQCSHAEGYNTTASNWESHAEGRYTIAASENQHTQGKFNISDATSTYAHIVGNGTSASKRSNAHTLDWDGNAWYQGDVYVGSTSGTNKDDGSKKLITLDEVKPIILPLFDTWQSLEDGITFDYIEGYTFDTYYDSLLTYPSTQIVIGQDEMDVPIPNGNFAYIGNEILTVTNISSSNIYLQLLLPDNNAILLFILSNEQIYISVINIADGLATEEYVDTAIANLVDSAPETLNTLNELATALQDNQDLTTTLNQAIGEKASLEDLNNHKNNNEVHITAAERETWNNTAATVSNLNQGLILTDTVTGINYMITIANGKVTLTEVSE